MMKGTFTRILLTAGLVGGLTGAAAVAQTTVPQEGNAQARPEKRMGRHGGKHRMGKRHGRGGLRGLRQLNLSDAQREQLRSIGQRFQESQKSEREELRSLMQVRRQGGQLTPEQQTRAQELMKAMRESRKALHQEMLGALTDEQRMQLEQQKKERKERREQFRQQRKQMRGDTL